MPCSGSASSVTQAAVAVDQYRLGADLQDRPSYGMITFVERQELRTCRRMIGLEHLRKVSGVWPSLYAPVAARGLPDRSFNICSQSEWQ